MTIRFFGLVAISAVALVSGCGGGGGSDGDSVPGGDVLTNDLIDGVVEVSYPTTYNVSTSIGIGEGVSAQINNSVDPNSNGVQILSSASFRINETVAFSDRRLCNIFAQIIEDQAITDPFNNLPLFEVSPGEQLVSQDEIVVNGRSALERITTSLSIFDNGDPASRLHMLYFFSANQTSFGAGLGVVAVCTSPSVTFGELVSEFRQIFSNLSIR